MSAETVFVDTNVLVYAHDRDAGRRRTRARERLESLWQGDRVPWISVQILQELYVNLVRRRVASRVARETVSHYLEWNVVDNDRELLVAGMHERERWKVSLWDAIVLAAARRAHATVLWSEDFSRGQDYEGIVVVDPLEE